MKKFALLIAMLISTMTLTFAQDIYLDIENYPNDTTLCLEFNQTVYVNAQIGCEDFYWSLNGQIIENVTPLIINPVEGRKTIQYYSGPSCDNFYHVFHIKVQKRTNSKPVHYDSMGTSRRNYHTACHGSRFVR